MALPALATPDDLAARNIAVPAGMDALTILVSASAAVREAAGSAILSTLSTVPLMATDWHCLDLPGGPVTAVELVQVAGSPVTGWTKFWDTLLMPRNWTKCLPVEVVVTYTHGVAEVPADIVDLVCALAGMAFSQDGAYGSAGFLQSERLGEYAYTAKTGADGAGISPMWIPDQQRDRLRARFGGSVAVIGSR